MEKGEKIEESMKPKVVVFKNDSKIAKPLKRLNKEKG